MKKFGHTLGKTLKKGQKSHLPFIFFTFLFLCSTVLFLKTKLDLDSLTDKYAKQNNRISALQRSRRELTDLNDESISFSEKGDRFSTNYGISFICSIDWLCKMEGNNLLISYQEGGNLATALKIELLTSQSLKNPNFSTPLEWYDALNHKDELALGTNLDELYGTTPVEGTDGLIFPFYRGYELDTLEPVIYGKHPALTIENTNTGTLNILIPEGDSVYRISTTMYSYPSDIVLQQLLDSIEFN